jgi:hypothetical protein
MVADDKIVEAEYFLDKIHKASERKDFNPNFNAFLSAAKSIFDYLLEDYNTKYKLGIQRNYSNNFEKAACKKRNLDALKFIDNYNREKSKIESDKLMNFLLEKRNITVHKQNTNFQKNVSVSIMDNIEKRNTKSETKFIWLFDDKDYKQTNVVESCQKLLKSMKEFVRKLKSNFP